MVRFWLSLTFQNMPSWFSRLPSTSGEKGSEIECILFCQICILGLCNKNRGGPLHSLDITVWDFVLMFICFGVQELRKTSGRWEFKRIWHLEHPNEFLAIYKLRLWHWSSSYRLFLILASLGVKAWGTMSIARSLASRPLRVLGPSSSLGVFGLEGKNISLTNLREIEIIFCTFRKCRFPENPSLKDP